jgi:transporter family-2 protein
LRATLFLPLLALLGGAAVAVQFAINSELRVAVRSPLVATAISFLIGTVVLIALVVVAREGMPTPAAVASAPWWAWLGGFLGAFYVFSSIVVTPRIGATATVGFVVAGQLLAALALDHFGLLNLTAQPVGVLRLLGVVLVLVGAVVVLRST